MKFAVLGGFALLAAAAVSAEDFKDYALDGGVSIALPSGWEHKQVENPAMKMKSMREMMVGASETRMKHGDTGILVSYMHFKTNKPSRTMDEAELGSVDAVTKQAAGQYLRQSVETEVAPRSAIVGDLGISLATLTARDGEQFRVAPGQPGGCVTTGSIRRGSAAWAVSIASKSCDSPAHTQAVEAFYRARTD